MNAIEINNDKNLLETMIHKALLDVMIWTEQNCKNAPQEPDYVAALSFKFPRSLFNILQIIFPFRKFSVTGVFCHQKPFVDFCFGKGSELGDLLLVFVDQDRKGNKLFNSILFQAKITDEMITKVKNTELHQLYLYKNWPEFKYSRAGKLNGEKRNITPKTISNGAQYLLIDKNPYTNGVINQYEFPIGCAMPDDYLIVDRSLACEIVNFLKFKTGRMFEDRTNISNDWSKMIWDLLDITNYSISRRKNIKDSRFNRKNSYVNYYSKGFNESSIFDGFEKNDFLDHVDADYIDTEGVSVVLIESSVDTDYIRQNDMYYNTL